MRLPMMTTLLLLTGILGTNLVRAAESPPLPGTKPLTLTGDIAAQLVDGVDRFLLREVDRSVEGRGKHWQRDFASGESYHKSLEPNRKRLAHILGVRDPRVPFDAPELVATVTQPALVGQGAGFQVFSIRWPAFGDVHGEGLLLVPSGRKPIAEVIALPDADQLPEQLVGLVPGVPPVSQFARRLAESGCRVIIPTLIDRRLEKRNGRANLTSREYLYRSAFELGRHLIGYEVQKVLALVDWLTREKGRETQIGIMGYGEGGMLALYAGALDTRLQAVCVSGYFGNRQSIWNQPLDRNVFRLLEEFGDAELAAMVAPRRLFIEASKGPELALPSEGGAPARLLSPTSEEVEKEWSRLEPLIAGLRPPVLHAWVDSLRESGGAFGTERTLALFLKGLGVEGGLKPPGTQPQHLGAKFDPRPRQTRQRHEIDRHSQGLLLESPYVRAAFMKELYDSAAIPSKFREVQNKYRDFFATQVIGRFDQPPGPANPRTRQAYGGEKWTGYDVVLDVFPEVIAYGILLLPKNLKPGEKRPVVVCQHGLEGRPQHVIGKESFGAYKAFAAQLAERGFITFAPQNLYIGMDRFRTLQRKANPLGKTLFSIMVPQHQQITDWLKTLPNVDPLRIAFYGLSYGGKSAMRIPPLVENYCLSICSADFNEWVWKNASTRSPYSYIWTGEYEIFEFDLGSTFNYAEMAALIAPRPFMVERGHFDGVAPDETVGYEFAKVRHFYQAGLGLFNRCEIEWFVGPHTINGKGTFAFLHRHLNWPEQR